MRASVADRAAKMRILLDRNFIVALFAAVYFVCMHLLPTFDVGVGVVVPEMHWSLTPKILHYHHGRRQTLIVHRIFFSSSLSS